jgi:hypothetical protein
MPSLLKFLAVVGILAGLAFAAVWSLATFVEPKPRDITIRVPSERFKEP